MIITHHWLRLWSNGPGVARKRADAPLLFSECMGFKKSLVLFGWRFTRIKSYK